MSKRQRSDDYSSEPKTHLITDINEMDELLKEEDVKIGDRIKITGLNQGLEDKPMYYIVKCEKKSVELVVPEQHEEEEDEIYGGKNKRRINRVRKSIKKIRTNRHRTNRHRTNRHRTIRHRKTTRRVKKTIRRK